MTRRAILQSSNYVQIKGGMNDLPVIRDLRYAQGILGSPGGKHWKSLEINIWREVVPSSKAVILNKE